MTIEPRSAAGVRYLTTPPGGKALTSSSKEPGILE